MPTYLENATNKEVATLLAAQIIDIVKATAVAELPASL